MNFVTAGQRSAATDHAFHILIVEDDRNLRESLANFLGRNQCRVKLASNVLEARRHLTRHVFDLAILDIMMPGEDGLSLCRDIRGGIDIPVILVSAKSEETDRIVGMEIGADDYLTKPFNPRELLARVKAVIRRSRSLPRTQRLPEVTALGFGMWTLNLARRELVGDDGVRTPLSATEFRLLMQFVQHPKAVLSREQLIEVTQGREAGPYERSIDNLVARIRKKIEPDPKSPTYLKTVWGGGYMFAADVVRL